MEALAGVPTTVVADVETVAVASGVEGAAPTVVGPELDADEIGPIEGVCWIEGIVTEPIEETDKEGPIP